MAEPAAYAPVAQPRPRISRDRTAIVLAVAAVASFLLGTHVAEWIHGRLNGEYPLDLILIGCASAWFVLGLVLLIRVASRFLAGTAMQRVRWLLLLGMLPLPYAVLMSGIATGYTGGFVSWTRANIDARAIRQWGATVRIDGQRGIESPRYWHAFPSPGILYVPVEKPDWPACVACANPKEVYVLSDRSAVILHWPASSQRWSRSVIIPSNTAWSPPPQCFLPVTNTGQGIWVCVRGPL